MNTRRFWQIHLSTAVVLMFVASLMLGLNIIPTKEITYISTYDTSGAMFDPVIKQRAVPGWPMSFQRRAVIFLTDTDFEVNGGGGIRLPAEVFEFSMNAMIVNILAALFILFNVGGLCEYIIRHREARKP